MPMYEYACPKCECRFEKQLTMDEYDTKRPRCPTCSTQAKHVMFAPPVHTRLSLMHPRHMRGQKGKFKIQEGAVME